MIGKKKIVQPQKMLEMKTNMKWLESKYIRKNNANIRNITHEGIAN